jgi:fumarate reductase flavoprotein subunit
MPLHIFDRSALPPDAPHAPVAIVGAGACGLTAALHLRDAGVECVLLERDASPQGSTALSSGFIPATGTAVQRAAGVEDSAAQFAHDIQAKAKGHAAPHLVQAYTQAIAPALARLETHGIHFQLLDGFLYPGHTARRMHAVQEKTGAALVAALERAALAAGAVLACNSRVDALYMRGDRVAGIGYVMPDGTRAALACDALVLACNGYGGNPQMRAQYLPHMRDAPFAGHAGNDGLAVEIAQALGARLADMGAYQGHGSWAVPHGVLVTWALMMQGGIQVNRLGRRFHDETQGYSEAAECVLAQPGGVAFNVFDTPLLELARGFPDFLAAEAAGAVKCFATVADLAQWIGCAPDTLEDTLNLLRPVPEDAHGKGVSNDRVFSRELTWPLYVIQVSGALFHTQGGLDIDAQCRVVDQHGAAFPNLFAAGGAARGVSGNAVWGYLSGNGLLSAVAGGAIAAQAAAQLVGAKHHTQEAA